MPTWLFSLIALFVKEVLQEILKDVDWTKAKADFIEWARKAMPGERLDDAAEFMASVFFDVLESVLKENPSLTFKAASRIAKRRLPLALARAHAARMKGK